LLAVTLAPDIVLVLDARTGKRVQQVGGHSLTIFALAFSPDSKTLALGTLQPSLQLWDVATGKRVRGVEQQPRDAFVTELAFAPDGKTLAVGRSNRIALTEVATGREVGRLEAPMRLSNGLAFLPGGLALVSGSQDGKVRVWDLRSRQVRFTLDGGAEGRSLALSPDGRAVALGTVRHAAVWDLPSARNAPQPREVPLAPEDRESLWSQLAEQDAPRAHQAVGRLVAAPGQAVSVLRGRLRPAAVPDPRDAQRLRRLIADLDSDSFPKRERAAGEVEKAGPPAVPLLRQTLAANPSVEVRRRAEGLLEKLERSWPASSPETLRTWRAIKILECVGTPDARQLLEKLAQGAPEDRLTQEAKASLGRLAQRGPR
jgi:hypothetical protein